MRLRALEDRDPLEAEHVEREVESVHRAFEHTRVRHVEVVALRFQVLRAGNESCGG